MQSSNTYILRLLLVWLTAWCFNQVGWAQTVQYPVTGTVLGPGGPVAGASVRIEGWDRFRSRKLVELQRVTDASGKFSGEIPEGVARVFVDPPSTSGLLSDYSGDITVPPGNEVRFTLARPITLTLRAVTSDGKATAVAFEVYSLSSDRAFTPAIGYSFLRVAAGQLAALRVPADRYSIHAIPDDSRYSKTRINVDARNGDLPNLTISVPFDSGPLLTRDPPRASLIRVSDADANGIASVMGLAGSVDGMSSVAVVNLLTHQANLTVSEPDGSFTLPMFAPPGSYLQIKHDPTGRFLPKMNLGDGSSDQFEVATGTIVYVPLSGDSSRMISTGSAATKPQLGDIRYRTWSVAGVPDPGQIWIQAAFTQNDWRSGGTLAAQGKLTYYSTNLTNSTDLSALSLRGNVMLEKIIDASGLQLQSPNQFFMSSIMTPTGFPIERYGYGAFIGNWSTSNPRRVGANRVEFDWTLTARLPDALASGIYRPQLAIWELKTAGLPTGGYHLNIFPSPESPEDNVGGALPVVRIGEPAANRLVWALGLNDFSNGTRGAIAIEDRGRFQLATHVKTNTDQFIIPRQDAKTGKTIRYRLEPFLPIVSHSTGRIAAIPQIPFKFPSGNLTVTIIRPDGAREELGSAPFVQNMSRTPTTTGGSPISAASQHVTDLYELTTLDQRFEYAFSQYGTYRVTMRGTVEDIYGTVYEGGGTYEVTVARTLSIDTGVVAGTPFQVGDAFSPVVHVLPGVPADVDVRVRLLPNSDSSKAIERHVTGRASRFGYFDPKLDDPIRLTAPGEYRVDITARYTDDQGTMWEGAVTWGSIVETPNSSLITHGRRGFDLADRIQQQWFRVRDARTGGDHVMYPFHTGDVMWLDKADPAADVPKISVQDAGGAFAARIRSRAGSDPRETPSLEDRIAAGEIPLFSSTSSGIGPSFDPGAVDQWGYFYAFAERPGIHVREFVSEDFNLNGYWRFRDDYNLQVGNGVNGDLPNDFKFHFGGAVYRSPADNFFYYGAYASLFVLLPENDPEGGRVFPPFQGAAGGPSGGPIMRLKGKAIDMFFHPTGTRPGSILEIGDIASFAGQIAPTLPSKVEITITSPSGRVRQLAGQANKVGYFYLPASDFVVDESGAYRVAVRVFHDGVTSAGNVPPPYPTGDVLGSAQGQFDFYAVSPSSSQPNVNIPRGSFRRPAFERIEISASAPALTGTQLRYTTVMPGFILEEGTASNLSYTYDATTLHQSYPNLDLTDADGFTGADPITFSMLISGRDSSGRLVYQARQIYLAGEELLALTTGTRDYALADRGAITLTSSGSGSSVQTGYVRIQPTAGSNTPTGMAIFGFRQGGVLVTEAAVPPAPLLRSGRIPVDVNGAINTGVAIANPNDQDANVAFYFTDSDGRDFGRGNMIVPANGQVAVFLNETPFNVADNTAATLTFTSNVTVAAVALRGRTNERSEFLLSALPVIDVSSSVTAPLLLPHVADGGGWTTEVTLVNPSDDRLSGTIQIRDQAGAALPVTSGGSTASSFSYVIQPRSSFRLHTSGAGSQIQVGSVRIEPAAGQKTPSTFAMFSFRNAGVMVSEAAVTAATPAASYRIYEESSARIQSGLALANTSSNEITVAIEALRLDGATTGLTGSLRLPANGQTALFVEQIPGLQSLSSGFQGVLRISTAAASLVVAGLRGRSNERDDFLITTLPAQSEGAAPTTSEMVFPHFADGGGYTTQFILMATSGRPSGTLKFVGPSGQWLQPVR